MDLLSPNLGNIAYVLQVLSSGAVNGCLYALVALAIVVIFRATSHLNFAVGEMGTLGAFVVFTFSAHLGWNMWLAIAVSMAASFLFGAAIQGGVLHPLERRGVFPVILATLAVLLVVNALVAIVWGTQPVNTPQPFPQGVGAQVTMLLGPPRFYLTYSSIGFAATLVVVLILIWLLLSRTKLGLAYRAVASNREASQLVGIPVGRLFMLGWGLSAAVGTLTAVLVAQSLGTLDFNLMGSILIYGITAATFGGLDSIKGAAVGGVLLGIIEAVLPGAFTFIDGDMGLIVALLVIVTTLLIRPQGLFGTARVERV